MWREWHEHVDPLIAGALRLTLDTPLEGADARQLERVARSSGDPAGRRLVVWLLSRADERPVSYSYSNSSELLARDDEKVERLNAVAEQTDLPLVHALRVAHAADDTSDPGRRRSSELALLEVAPGFPPGLPGLTKAIRTWHRRPYDTQAAAWHPERFANAIGYRLISLVAEGRRDDATSALTTVADDLGERTVILRSIAEGLERHGETALAARAYALSWTRMRGHGGWLTFGGETAIASVQRATALDTETARGVVAEEIERAVAAGGSGTYGITQAVIYALAVGALSSPDGPAANVAFTAWDEAFAVIASRAPRVDDSDDPDLPYKPPQTDCGEPAPGDLDRALVLAALGGLGHPGREKKRRALLATRLLLDERPAVVAPAVALALTTISDPATLTWLLSLLGSIDATTNPVLQACQSAFRDLTTRELLTTRAVARRMITGAPPDLAPSTPGETARAASELWTPDGRDDNDQRDPPGFDELLTRAAGRRLRRGERVFPGLEQAVRSAAAPTLNSDGLHTRLNRQLDAFGDRINRRWPDAFLARNQAIEESLQTVAAGGRAAMIMSGEPIADPSSWEDLLAAAILDSPAVPLTLEAHRQPRPAVPPPRGPGWELWAQIHDSARGHPSARVEDAAEKNGLLFATLTLQPVSSLLTVQGGRYNGWRWLGTLESRAFEHPDWRENGDLIARRYRAIEVRMPCDRQSLTLPPVGEGDLRWWKADVESSAAHAVLESSGPLIGVDQDLEMVGDGREGLGVPDSVLVPMPSLVALLGLRPGPPCSYEDDSGAGLALVTWRAEYDVSDYYLAWPRTYGSGVVIRADLLAELVAGADEHRFVVRDFVVGLAELAQQRSA